MPGMGAHRGQHFLFDLELSSAVAAKSQFVRVGRYAAIDFNSYAALTRA